MKQSREQAIEMVKQRLLRRSMPRLQMTLILSVTGATGFLLSFLLLHTGITRMWLRYPIAILLAYCVFLLILRFWLFAHSKERGPSLDFDPDALDMVADGVDISLDAITNAASRATETPGFSGGDFGGGGTGGHWAESMSSGPAAPHSSGGGGSGFGLDFGFDLEEGCLIVLALIAILGGIIAALYVVYIAPVLLAEILVDGLLLTGLYRRMKGAEQRHWLQTAVRKTLVPALVVALFFSVGGYLLQQAVPDAHSIGGVWTSGASKK